ncbi:MAG: PmbA/TldD family protein, partial [Candidatus Methanoperedens nitroreducens]
MDFYDTRIIKSISTSIVLDNGQIREISNNFSSGGAVRVLDGGSWGFVSLDGVVENTDAAISSAGRLAESARNRSPRNPIDLAPIKNPDLKDLPVIKEKPQDIPIEDKVKLLLEIEKSAKKPGIQSTNAVYSESLINVKYSSSEGLDCEYTLTRVGFAISSIAQSEGVYQIGRESRFGVMGFEIFKKHDAFALAEKAATTAIELLSAKTPKAGTYPVILDQELAGVFIHEAVGHAVEADHVLEGNSILSGKIGEQIASP